MDVAAMVPPLYTLSDLPQVEVLRQLRAICFPDARSILDPTYGKGNFWPSLECYGCDRDHARALHVQCDYTALPFADHVFDLVVFDPPYQPSTSFMGNGGKILAQFSKLPGGVDGVEASVRAGLQECWRVARVGIIVKVQDYIHNHKPVWMSRWVWDTLGEPYDFVAVRQQAQKMKATNWTTQKSVYRNHSTFYAYRRRSIR